MTRYLISVTTPNYIPKGARYWNSLGLIRSAKPVIVLLDFTPETDPEGRAEAGLRGAVDWAEYRHLPLPDTHSNFMVQHGRFLDALPDLPDDALICLTDTDVRIQRDLTEVEWVQLAADTAGGQLCAYYNCGPNDNLALEALRIDLSDDWKSRYGTDDYLKVIPCNNCGVLFGRAGAFRCLQTLYESLCEEFYANAPHRCRCQFLINYCVWKYMGGFVTLPGQIHQHGHWASEDGRILGVKGVGFRTGTLCYRDEPVVFVHNFPE
jgi:hypothetical protein